MCDEYEAELRRMGIIEKIVIDDETMRKLEERARQAGKPLDHEAADLVRLGLEVAPVKATLIERSRALRASLGPQKTDSLTLLREDRDR
jgi:hypothetical protein